jgi:hypothetical protein
MDSNVQQKSYKSLFFTEDRLNIWVTSVTPHITSIHVTDPELCVTYDIADFDGAKYHIKHDGQFNDSFIRAAKRRPQIVRDLLKFHRDAKNDADGFDDLKIRMNCFKRRVSIYTKKTLNKTKRILS